MRDAQYRWCTALVRPTSETDPRDQLASASAPNPATSSAGRLVPVVIDSIERRWSCSARRPSGRTSRWRRRESPTSPVVRVFEVAEQSPDVAAGDAAANAPVYSRLVADNPFMPVNWRRRSCASV